MYMVVAFFDEGHKNEFLNILSSNEIIEKVEKVKLQFIHKGLRMFDVYEGKGIDPERKSLALGLTFRDSSRTLSDEVVNLAVDQVVDLLRKNYNAELRS